ncbi:Up-regulated during septation-domain-containing protein [Tricharina praecox]|uniref:Up-regulated during septation-domain-containing protein n=1 Tax=Tricharina praecox TaxID=43433 RepID=UPI0022206A29|nr:Up-regulated during septation-domain-containing protein [Tricharina praecox]KAI5855923.1 Up-regulated during septation-domain-containing protein [Tricharina praecox]
MASSRVRVRGESRSVKRSSESPVYLHMTPSPYPPPSGRPPPVPPKKSPIALPPLNCDAAGCRQSEKIMDRPRYRSPLSRIPSFSELRSSPAAAIRTVRSPTPEQSSSPTKQAVPKGFMATLSEMDGRISPSSPSSPTSRLVSAKQKARDVWMSLRQGNNAAASIAAAAVADVEPQVKAVRILAPCLDSPTLPEHLMINTKHKRQFSDPISVMSRDLLDTEALAPRQRRQTTVSGPPRGSSARTSPTEGLQTPPTFLLDELKSPTGRKPKVRTQPPVESKSAGSKKHSDSPKQSPTTTKKEEDVGENGAMRHKRRKGSISKSGVRSNSVRVSEAQAQLPQAEIASLQRKAMRQCEKFNVLSLEDVGVLSQELLELDSRCDYLRSTRASLRQGRRALHTRMITYLRTARSGAFSQENLLRQEEALADLDTAIEDWESKLEQAEQRRMEIKQMLLEHVAAALSIVNGLPSASKDTADSPPATSEQQKQQRRAEQDSTITVYAVKQEVQRRALCP